MQHLDEGTIHAWLDGELPFEESSRVAAHAEVCDKCTAMIAEARGFLAASSRILRNLDEVPGDVVPPGQAHATADGGSVTPRDLGIVLPVPRTSGPRRWIPSRFAAAAAVAVLAVGTYTILNRSTPAARSEFSVPAADVAPRADVQLVDSTALSAANEQVQEARAAAPSAAAPPPVPTVPTPGQRTMAQQPAPTPVVGRGADVRAKEAPAPTLATTERSVPPAAQLADVRVQGDSVEKKADAAGAALRDTPLSRARQEAAAVAPQAAKTLAVPAESVVASERRRITGEVDSRLQNVEVTGAAGSTLRRAGPAVTLRTAPGCYDIMRGDAEMQAAVPPAVRLASSQIRVGNRTLRLAVVQGMDTPRGVRWYWSLGDGRIILHKVVGGAVEYEGPIVAVRRPC